MSKEFDVEQGLSRLQEINTKLSEGDLPLGEAMKLYKEGVELANKCKENLYNKGREEMKLNHLNAAFEIYTVLGDYKKSSQLLNVVVDTGTKNLLLAQRNVHGAQRIKTVHPAHHGRD